MKKILLFGEPMVMFLGNEVGALSKVDNYKKRIAGAELNVAIGLKRLGLDPIYYCRLGKDQFGDYIEASLQKRNIDNVITRGDGYTGFQFKSKTEDHEADVYYYRKGSEASKLSISDFEEYDFKQLDWVHITGIPLALSKEMNDLCFYIVKKCKEFNIPFSFDPNVRYQLWDDSKAMIHQMNKLAYESDVFLPGIQEARLLSGLNSIDDMAEFYLCHGTKAVIFKNGKEGSIYFDKYKKVEVPGVYLGKTVDTVGAGDGFAVGVIYSMLNRFDSETMLKNANIIGSRQVTVEGDNEGLPTCEELKKLVKRRELYELTDSN